MKRWLGTGFLAGSAFIAATAGANPSAADPVDAVTTPGSGALTICRNWLVYESCTTYHRVRLPEQIAIGDRFTVTFGSNPKDYSFAVARILQQGETCTVFSKISRPDGPGEKIEVAQCRAAPNP